MFWKHLKKSTPEQEAEFRERMDEEKIGWKDGFAMVIAAFFTIVLPCILILVGISAFVMWIFGLL